MSDREFRQYVMSRWAIDCFGEDEATDPKQRVLRFLEESVELAQAIGLDREKALELVAFVYNRPAGDVQQELGQVGLTLMLVAECVSASADIAEQAECKRVLAKPREHYTARNQAKNDAGLKA